MKENLQLDDVKVMFDPNSKFGIVVTIPTQYNIVTLHFDETGSNDFIEKMQLALKALKSFNNS